MKNILKLLWIAYLFIVCQNSYAQKNYPFTITGKIISTIPEQTIYLIYNGKTIDSCFTDEEGNFNLTGRNNEELLYSIFYKKPQPRMIYLAISKENISMMIYPGNKKADPVFEDFSIEGSPSSYALNLAIHLINNSFAKKFRASLDSISTFQAKGDSVSTEYAINQLNRHRREYIYANKYAVDTTKSPMLAFKSLIGMEVVMDLLPDDILLVNTLDEAYKRAAIKFENSDYFQNFYANYLRKKESATSVSKINNINQAPFSLPDRDGIIIDYKKFKGSYVLVDFWASWCAPCRKENPYLIKAYNLYNKKNFNIVSISIDKQASKAKWMKAIKDDQIGEWTHLINVDSPEENVTTKYNFNSIPYNLLIAPDGKILATRLRGDKLIETLSQYLK